MQKIFSLLIIPLLLFENSQSKLTIENGRPENSIKIQSDYNFIEAVYEKFSNKRPIPLTLFIDYDHNQGALGKTFAYFTEVNKKKQITHYRITTENSRGLWFNEISHYFAHQLPEGVSKEEFKSVVMSNFMRGVTTDDVRKKYNLTGLKKRGN